MIKKLNNYYIKNKSKSCIILGLILITIAIIPYFILGEDSIVRYHDQLDGELLVMIYQAKYLFSESDIIMEFMNGMDKNIYTPTAPLFVLFYAVFPPFIGYVINQYIIMIIAFCSMFFCLKKITQQEEVSFLVAILYSCLPINVVFGFVLWIPLIIYCFYNLYKKEYILLSMLGLLFYATASSFVTIGYACIFFSFLTLIWLIMKDKKLPLFFITGLIGMSFVYSLFNKDLILQVLGFGNTFVSHRDERVLNSQPFWSTFWNQILYGGEHMLDFHGLILLLATFILVIGGIAIYRRKITESFKSQYYLLITLSIINISICLFAAIWSSEFTVALKLHLGGIFVSFQAERFYWLAPTFWYLIFGISLSLLFNMNKEFICNKKLKRVGMIFGSLIYFVVAAFVLKASHIKPNIQTVINRDYGAISWNDYYAEDIFDEIDEFIGRDKESYRVVSLGMPPSIALYNGFYCLDGYSNNYSLSYKYEFREIIESELEKNDYIKNYYDSWGNRCYIYSAEAPGQYMIEKGGFTFQDLSLNTEKLAEMGGEYLFSAAKILNAKENDLVLIREEPFETEDSYWNVFVYEVNESKSE